MGHEGRRIADEEMIVSGLESHGKKKARAFEWRKKNDYRIGISGFFNPRTSKMDLLGGGTAARRTAPFP
jgi:hypothetical protein